MQRIYGILLLAVMLFGAFRGPIALTLFEINVSEIAALLCENRDVDPESDPVAASCGGSCQAQKLVGSESDTESDRPSERQNPTQTHLLVALPARLMLPSFDDTGCAAHRPSVAAAHPLSGVGTDIFHPPRT